MNTAELREKFALALSAEILEDPTAFYTALDEDAVLDFLTAMWEKLCVEQEVLIADHAFFPEHECWLLEEEGETAAYLLAIELPALRQEPDYHLMSVVFGTAMDPRVFAGARTEKTVTLYEYTSQNQKTEVGSFADASPRREVIAEQVYAVCDAYCE